MEQFFPMDSVSGDRVYYASDFAAYFADIINSGVSNNGGRLPISLAGGMQLNVGPGIAWLKGHIYENTTTKTLTLSIGSSYPRMDRIVCRLNIPERLISTIVVKGTPAVTPAAPALVRDGDYYDIGLATVLVRANAISIYEADITDTRGDPLVCGAVTILGKESTSNKVSTITADSTDTQYPSAKAVFDLVKAIVGSGSGGNGKIIKNKIITMTSPSGAYLGDINGDGVIDTADVVKMDRYIDGLDTSISDAADINGDGKIDSEDAAILRAFTVSDADKNKHTIARVTEYYTDDSKYTYYAYVEKLKGTSSGITDADKQAIVNEVLSKLDESTLTEIINAALERAKESGAFNGKDGKTPQNGVDYNTPADQEAIVQQVITALGTPVFGRVDEENNIILTGELTDGTYTLKYEDADGNMTVIGTLAHDADAPNYTNWIPISTDTDDSIYNGTGYAVGKRISSSNVVADVNNPSASNVVFLTGFIPCRQGDIIRLKNCYIDTNNVENVAVYGTNGWSLSNGYYDSSKNITGREIWTDMPTSNFTSTTPDASGIVTEFTIKHVATRLMRLCLAPTGDPADAIVTVNEEII